MLNRFILVSFAALLFISIGAREALTQPAPTPEQLTLRPGDKLRWFDPSGGHVVQFGGAPLKALADVLKIFTFEPPLELFENDTMGFSPQGGSPMLTATVKANAAQSGVTAIDFTCGMHPPDMQSRLFQIAPSNGQPPRELTINAVGLDWMLETSAGSVKIDTALVDPSRRLAGSHAAAHHH